MNELLTMIEEMIGIVIVRLRPLVTDSTLASTIIGAAAKFLPIDVLSTALSDEARKRVDAAVDAAEKAKTEQ